MRVAGWHSKEVFQGIMDEALKNANDVMDDVVQAAKSRCPVSPIVRAEGHKLATISFTPKSGRGKNKPVSFKARQYQGRRPGQLRDTIRRTNKPGSGNVRVYAGSGKAYYAHMVERGTSKTAAQPFLRPAFEEKKNSVLAKIKNGK